jgi:hypothetical protein
LNIQDFVSYITQKFDKHIGVSIFYGKADTFRCLQSNMPDFNQGSLYNLYEMPALLRALSAQVSLVPQAELEKFARPKILCKVLSWDERKKVIFFDTSSLSAEDSETLKSVVGQNEELERLFDQQREVYMDGQV